LTCFGVSLTFATLLSNQAAAYSINETERGRRIRWADSKVVFQIDPAIAQMLPPGRVETALQISMDAWRGFEGVPEFQISSDLPGPLGHAAEHPTNGIYLPEVWDHESDKLAITVVTYEMASGRLLDADVVVNPNVVFGLLDEYSPSRQPSYDLAAVLTHEMGHVLGLGESHDDRMATMWPYADRGDTHQRTLSEDDEAGVIDAYDGPPPLPAAACAQMTVAGAGRHAPPVWLAFLTLSAMAWLAWRSSPRARRGVVMAGGAALIAVGGGAAHRELDSSVVGAAEHHAVAAIELSAPAAQLRISRAFNDLSATRVGIAKRVATRAVNGMLFTDLEVATESGERVQLSVPGGELDGIGQIVGHGNIPIDGDELMVEPGTKRFAFHAEGHAWGGSLGEGPAIKLQ
jgi:hypothetical protein